MTGPPNQSDHVGAPYTCTKSVTNGKLRSEAGSPVVCGLYQLLPAAAIKYTYMKTSMKVMAVAIALSSAALLLHYLIGSMSY